MIPISELKKLVDKAYSLRDKYGEAHVSPVILPTGDGETVLLGIFFDKCSGEEWDELVDMVKHDLSPETRGKIIIVCG